MKDGGGGAGGLGAELIKNVLKDGSLLFPLSYLSLSLSLPLSLPPFLLLSLSPPFPLSVSLSLSHQFLDVFFLCSFRLSSSPLVVVGWLIEV